MMRTVVFLLVATLLTLALGAVSVLAEPPLGTPGPTIDEIVENEVDVSIPEDVAEIESEEVSDDPEYALPTFSPAGERLVKRMADGFLKKINGESEKWYECGILTPKENKPLRTEKIARYLLAALREYDMKWINPWGPLAVMYSESRGDQCAIGPNSRKAAIDLKLIDSEKPFNQWTKNDVESLLNNPKWKRSRENIGADLGLGQQVWKRFARILDKDGQDFCGNKNLRCRVPHLDEILSVENGPKVVATGMLTRSKWHRSKRPWEYWPGTVRSIAYDMRITALIYTMGGKDDERATW